MFETVGTFSYAFSRMFYHYPSAIKAKKLLDEGKYKEEENFLMDRIVVKSIEGVMKRSKVNIDVLGRENIPQDGPFVLVANHQGYFDVIAMMYAMGNKRVAFIAKKEFAKIGILKKWIEVMGGLFIDRKNPREAMKTIIKAEELVASGVPMAVFPEGTRSRKSEMGEFKTGVFKIIEKTKVPVIPLSIEGSYNIMEANNNKIKPGKINVTIGKPIDTSNYDKQDFRTLPDKVKQIILENKREIK